MKPVKFAVFHAALATTVAAAVLTLGAQEPSRAPEPRPRAMVWSGPSTSLGAGSQLGVTVRELNVEPKGSTLPTEPKGSAPPKEGKGQTLHAGEGVRIEDVTTASPAEKAGLKVGDIVVEYDRERVRGTRQFTRLVQETPAGLRVKIAVLRNGQKQTVEATPEARAFAWNMDVDGDQIRREVERGMQGLREFRIEPPAPDLRFDAMPPPMGRSSRGPAARLGAGRLGVTVQALSPQLAEYFGAKTGGALVSSVTKDSPADKAGLKAGDVIASVNGDTVRDPDDLIQRLSAATGSEVSIGLLREKKELVLKAGIGDR